MTRTMTFFAIGVAIAAIAAPAIAQPRPGPVVLTAHALRGAAYWIEGGLSNSGFVVGDKGVIAIDAQKSEEDARQALSVIAKVTPRPVDMLIVTHGDPDHIGGAAAFAPRATIVVHENTAAAVDAAAADPAGGGPVYAAMYAKLKQMPLQTIASTETRTVDGVKMVLMHVAPGHSSGDLMVYLPAQKIVFAGDVVLTSAGDYPIIHIGGSSEGWIEAVRAILALDADTYVSGHGPIESKAQLAVRLKTVETRRAAIKAMVEQKKTLAEIDQALPQGAGNPMFPSFNHTTYDELTKGYPAAVAPWINIVKR